MSQIYLITRTDAIITVASWEERFIQGIIKLLDASRPKRVIMFYYEEYADWSKSNRERLSRECQNRRVQLVKKELSFISPANSWKTLVSTLNENVEHARSVTLDISTMPREAIWTILNHTKMKVSAVQYVYNKPMKYGDWSSRNPGKPRLVYQLGGIYKFGKPVALVIMSGYDVERAKQLMRFYEPEKLIIGLQVGDQYENAQKNREKHLEGFSRVKDIEWFDVDGYSVNGCLELLQTQIGPLTDSHNLILSSLGPKLSALSLYAFHIRFPATSLSYAPSFEFNKEYSAGIDEMIAGKI